MGYVLNRGTKATPKWYCKFRDLDGKWKQKNTHQQTKSAALLYTAEIEARVARGQAAIPVLATDQQPAKNLTVGELAARFLLEYSRPRLRNRAKYGRQAASAFNQRLYSYPLANMEAAKVRRIHVEAHRDALTRDGYLPATVNDAIVRVSHLYNWAIDHEIIDGKNPCSHVERMIALPSEECYTRAEVERLLLPENLDPMIAVALYTGMRCGELAGLTWECVRFDLGRLDVRRSFTGPTKNGKPRVVPLHPELMPILRDWQARCPENPEQLVFPVQARGRFRMHDTRTLRKVRRILAGAGCPADLERPWHAMRRTFATLFSESGGARDALEDILGHITSGNRITARYVITSVVHLAREMDKLTLRPTPPAKVYTMADYRQSAS